MRIGLAFTSLYFAFASIADMPPEAPTGFDDRSNGVVNDETHQADQERFEEFDTVQDGLGPLYNAQSCRECHQDPKSGGASQVTELRAGRLGPDHRFQNPRIPIARGAEIISGRTLVNDRAICPNESFPTTEIHERVPQSENIRTTRISLNLLGDGFVEAVADKTLIQLSRKQCRSSDGEICGQVLWVPVVEAPGHTGVGRFGWKNQHSSLLSFSGDSYLNEMGITSRLFPDEITNLCNTVGEPNSTPDQDGMDDVDHFVRFIRSTKAPPRDTVLARTPKAKRGSVLFAKIGCATCHVQTLQTAPPGTKINGGTYTIPEALGGKTFHPFSDFLLHDVGTGDGIVMAVEEHYGRSVRNIKWKNFSFERLQATRNKVRTAPLWGVRLRTRLMHDGASVTFADAIRRHRGEASGSSRNFYELSGGDREALLDFLRSL
ncbi:MAG TPA: di-heme oxidoredictase family protein [Burkholderiales bacterium]|nr:di-heme oxidoredictase family protein [Burkholderiales bacterium]